MNEQEQTTERKAEIYIGYKGRSKHDESIRAYKGEPQFRLADLYITPFNYKRSYTADGRKTYVPIEVNRQPTGIHVMDDLLRTLTAGTLDLGGFCDKYGARMADLDALIFWLTGLRGIEFRQAYQLRLADDLLRYTTWDMPDVARRSGHGSRISLYQAYKRDLDTTPSERRALLREEGDEDKYRLDI